jgi:hypothetical protein
MGAPAVCFGCLSRVLEDEGLRCMEARKVGGAPRGLVEMDIENRIRFSE